MDNISLGVNQGETLVLLGRSGSGKTTALRLANRMLTPASGCIEVDGHDISSMEPIALRRRIGYVIQDFGLLPHWTVARNIGLVPELLRWDRGRIEARARELITQVGLEGMADRYPDELSGGQRQRVAVARALAAGPELVLLDEPFGALDPVRRKEMQELFLRLRKEQGWTSVFVTHDVLEALRIGSRIAVLDAGKVEGVFTPEEFVRAQTPVARAFAETIQAA